MKIVVIGYGLMFSNLILGISKSSTSNNICGVLRQEQILNCPFILKLKDFFCPSQEKVLIDSLELFEIKNIKSVNSEGFKRELLRLNPDIVIVGNWSEKFEKEIIDIPKIATINVHPSLLPKYRGPNPYVHAIANGEKFSGVTFHLMNTEFDKGEILLQVKVPILKTDTGSDLRLRICQTAKDMVNYLLNDLQSGSIVPIRQDESIASYQKAISEKDILISFKNLTTEQISRKIRGFYPWQQLFFAYPINIKKDEFFYFKINNFEIICDIFTKFEPGQVIEKTNRSITIVCKDKKAIKFSNLSCLGLFQRFKVWFMLNFKVRCNDIIP